MRDGDGWHRALPHGRVSRHVLRRKASVLARVLRSVRTSESSVDRIRSSGGRAHAANAQGHQGGQDLVDRELNMDTKNLLLLALAGGGAYWYWSTQLDHSTYQYTDAKGRVW